MKKVIIILVTLVLFVQACSQTTEEIEAAFVHNTDTDTEVIQSSLTPLLDAMSVRDFKVDFIGFDPHRKPLNPTNCPLLFKHAKTAELQDKKAFMDAYPAIKADIIHYLNQDRIYHSADFQSIANPMLRYQFLPDNSEMAIAETQFLLDQLIECQAIDLDVLTDAYLKIKPRLKEDEQKKYKDYVTERYWKDRKKIQDTFLRMKEGYETSTGVEKRKYLYEGRRLMRISRALQYTNNLLHIETQ